MSKKETMDLESADAWDFDQAEVHPPIRGNRAIVSVAFPRASFDQVTKSADRHGMRVSEFIREAALEKATRQAETVSLTSVSGPFVGVIILDGKVASGAARITRVPGASWIPNETHPLRQIEYVNEPTTV